jgi:hypothetical protein
MQTTELGHTHDPQVSSQAGEHVGSGARSSRVDEEQQAPARGAGGAADSRILLMWLARDGIELGR